MNLSKWPGDKNHIAYENSGGLQNPVIYNIKKIIHPQSTKIQMNENSTQFIRKSHKTLCFRYQYLYPRVWAQCLSHVRLFVTPRTVAHQVPLFMGFSRQEYWSGLPFPPPGDLPEPGIEPTSPVSPVLGDRFLTTGPQQKSSLSISVPISIYLSIYKENYNLIEPYLKLQKKEEAKYIFFPAK